MSADRRTQPTASLSLEPDLDFVVCKVRDRPPSLPSPEVPANMRVMLPAQTRKIALWPVAQRIPEKGLQIRDLGKNLVSGRSNENESCHRATSAPSATGPMA